MHTLVLATTNAGKVRELAGLLEGIPGVHVAMPKELLGYTPDVVEDGETRPHVGALINLADRTSFDRRWALAISNMRG